MPLKLLGSTSGYTQIDAASVAANNTITLPSTSGTIVVTNGGQTLEFADGSASTPSITNSGDTNTGLFFPEADGVSITTGGSERFRFGPSGELGIGGATYGTSGQVLKSSGSGAPPTWGSATEFYSQSSAPSSPSAGATWYDTDDGVVYIYANNSWVQLNDSTIANSNRGLFGGGSSSPYFSAIDYINIATAGNAASFGSLTLARSLTGSCSSSSRALWAGGSGDSGRTNVIDYVEIAVASNAFDFGDLTAAKNVLAGCSNGTRGVFGGGSTGSNTNAIDYITIATTGNATNFGQLTRSNTYSGACAGGDRGVWFAGSPATNVIDYVTISTAGNAVDFGDMGTAKYAVAACSNGTRGVVGAGTNGSIYYSTIEYITIATTGNATSFGDLTAAREAPGSCSNGTRGVWGGGRSGSSVFSNTIDYITISTTGNATDFGDLSAEKAYASASSGFYGAA